MAAGDGAWSGWLAVLAALLLAQFGAAERDTEYGVQLMAEKISLTYYPGGAAPYYWASPDVLAAVPDIDQPFSVTETFYLCLVIRTDRRPPPLTIISTSQSRSLGNSPNSGRICKKKPNVQPTSSSENAQGCVCAVFQENGLFLTIPSVAMHRLLPSIGYTDDKGRFKVPRTKALPSKSHHLGTRACTSESTMLKSAVTSPKLLLAVTFIRDSVMLLPISDHLWPTWAR
ncbi:uncharacterized protein TRIVIDRAFT_62473 [Trichoderma virens Gv29-8]|uniref:Uncharacterized protein n=1 Tax=Hypocrea virens (strain Gv29-8 / FGSC 10586) TaxID=413071 RepID=G9MK01_HYPVG|nr:uncharacterized protein TRIVIDRAFT_62473 [Trichoderma virens Gv29-8]EHK25806.1 hypothetical protein TRIVIDRAFT_62473 [Trichoderma virens Gv29-8]UKZ48370.1 hypothetical protein TrVGV298_002593 [Trichoderma virens]